MSLSLALNNALSGLKISQQSLAVVSQNIANANNETYVRQKISQSSQTIGNEIGAGVILEDVTRVVDEYINKTVISRSSGLAKSESIDSYYQQLQVFLGAPGKDNSLDTYVNDFFASINNLSSSTSPDRGAARQNVVNRATNLASSISQTATNIQTLRFEADQDIKQVTNEINAAIKKIYDLNKAILSASSINSSINGVLDEMDATLSSLAKNLDIKYYVEPDNTYTVTTNTGQPLVQLPNHFQLQYDSIASVQNVIEGFEFNSVTVHRVGSNGEVDDEPTYTLIEGGLSTEVTTDIKGGKLKGLLEIRDKLFPDILGQFDEFAANFRDVINAVHNDGVSVPPQTNFTGTRLIDPNLAAAWSGVVTFSLLDSSGLPIDAPYDLQEGGFEALKLNLGALDDGNGAGRPSYQAIIDEINEYYGVPQNRATLGNIHNVELIALTDTLDGGTGTFNFGLDIKNLSANAAGFRITGASASGGAVVTSPGAFPTTTYSVAAGSNTIAGPTFTLNMAPAGAGPYDITVDFSVDDPGGGPAVTGTITYSIDEATAGIRNQRYAADSVTGLATIEAPNGVTSYMRASLVDINGNEIPRDPATDDYLGSGYLKLETTDGDYRIAISEGSSNQSLTDRGFSYFFGMNNFFVDDGLGTEGAAVKMAVRSDIASDSSRLSTARLYQTEADADGVYYTQQISTGDTAAMKDIADLALRTVAFRAAGGVGATSVTFSDYAAEILGYTAGVSSQASENVRTEDLLLSGFTAKKDAISGVNIDEEMANTIIFQNAYAANARVISTTRELFNTLLDAF